MSATPQSNNAPEHKRPATPRRRRVFRYLLGVFALIVVVLLGTVIYLQSGHAVRHLYLPIASDRIGTRITATDGTVRLTGMLRLENIVLRGTDGQPAFRADQINVELSPLSLLGEHPHVHLVRVTRPDVRVTVDEKGSTNWDFMPSEANREDHAEPSPDESAPSELPAVVIDQIQVDSLLMEYRNAEGLILRLDRANLIVENLAPGQTGTYGLTAEALIVRPELNMTQQTDLSLDGSLAQGAERMTLEWQTRLDADMTTDMPGLEELETVSMNATLDGQYHAMGRLNQQFSLNAAMPAGSVGNVEGRIHWDRAKQIREASLRINQLDRPLLNLMAAAMAPLQVASGRLDGNVELAGQDQQVEFQADLNGSDLSFRFDPEREPTQPVALKVSQSGTFDPKNRSLRWTTLEAALSNADRVLLEATLDRPVTLDLNPAEQQLPPHDESLASEAARIKLAIHDVAVETMRPWLALAHQQPPAGLEAGHLNGQADLAIAPSGRRLTLEGQFDWTGLQWAPVAGPKGTFRIEQSARASLEEMRHLEIETFSSDLIGSGQHLARNRVSGHFDLAPLSGTLNIQTECPQVLTTLKVLGLARVAERPELSDGAFTASQTLEIDSPDAIRASGQASLVGVSVQNRTGPPIPLGFHADYGCRLDMPGGLFTLESCRMELEPALATNAEPALIEAGGTWPISTGGDAQGQIKLSIRRVNMAPFLRLMPQLRNEALPPIPLEANETLRTLPGGGFRLEGQVQLGLPPMEEQGSALTMTLRNEAEKLGDRLESLILEMGTRRGSEPVDQVRFEGNGRITPPIDLQFQGRIASLRLDPYAAWARAFRAGDGPTPAHEPKSGEASGRKTPEPTRPSTPAVMDATLDIGRLTYRTLELTEAQGQVRMENGNLVGTLDKGSLNGGTITLNVTYEGQRLQPRFAWDARLEEIPVTPLLRAAHDQWGGKASGRLTANSRGTGEGTGARLRQTLQSDTDFVVLEGRLQELFLLEELARATRLDEFRQLSFDRFEGVLVVRDGEARLPGWTVKGDQERLKIAGTIGLDGRYDLKLTPSVSGEKADRISDNPYLRQLLEGEGGFFKLPVALKITGKGQDYRVSLDRASLLEGRSLQDSAEQMLDSYVEGLFRKKGNR